MHIFIIVNKFSIHFVLVFADSVVARCPSLSAYLASTLAHMSFPNNVSAH